MAQQQDTDLPDIPWFDRPQDLHDCRVALGLDTEDIAGELDVDRRTVMKWGTRAPQHLPETRTPLRLRAIPGA